MNAVSIVIPAYNEEGNIEQVIRTCLEVLPPMVQAFEVLIINDGSTDKTGEKAQELAFLDRNVRVFHHEKNHGMGAAVATGVAHVRYEIVCTIPADLQFDVREIGTLLPLIQNSDIVASFRQVRDYNLYRWVLTYSNLCLLQLLFGLRTKDPNWVKLFRKNVYQALKITSRRFFWDAEILIKAKKHGLRITEVGVRSYPRTYGKSSAISPVATTKTFFELIRFWLGGH